MIIEGNLLVGVLIAACLGIAAVVTYVRFAVNKGPQEAGSLFSRLFGPGERGGEEEGEDEGGEAEASAFPEPAAAAGAGPGTGLSLPVPGPDSANQAAGAGGEKPRQSFSFRGQFGRLFRGRKNKAMVEEEVRAIDEQLNSVLQVSEQIGAGIMGPAIDAGGVTFSPGRGMRELDLEMGALDPSRAFMKPEELKLEPPAPDVSSVRPQASPGLPGEAAGEKKADAAGQPAGTDPAKAPPDLFGGPKKSTTEDLLSDLEATARPEEEVDLSIMKEFKDTPFSPVELEADLKGILDQITINAQSKRNARM